MRLLLPSLLFFAYAVFGLIRPLPYRPVVKALLAAPVLAVSLKYLWYGYWGGSFFTPTLPRALLLVMEALYAALLILCFLLLCRDILGLGPRLLHRLGLPTFPPLAPTAQGAGLLICALALGCWGTWQSVRAPVVRTVEITLPRLPSRLDGLTLVQLTDLHIHTLLDRRWLRTVVERANAQHPDLIVLTGDFGDKLAPELADDMAPLAALRARYGVYGVIGNHECYFHARAWERLLTTQGVDMLRNAHRVLAVRGERLVIAGISDPAERRFGGAGPDLAAALDGAPEAVRILLSHRPGGAAGHGGVDLQLSGHTHGGQLFFLKPLIAAFNSGFVGGLYTIGGLRLYVSPGAGLWGGFSCRLGAPSEITRLVLRSPTVGAQDYRD